VLRDVGLLNQSNNKISTFSRGMKQRLGLARCLLHEPDLLILDEPISGLDPTGKKEIMEKLMEIRDSGKTIFLSSHELRYMDDICDQICVIKNGKIIAHDTPDTLIADIKGMSNYVILLKKYDKKIDNLQRVFPEIRELSVKQNILHLRVKETKDFEKKFLSYLLQNNIDFSIKTHKIDAIYSKIFEEKT
jgi:ABC-2 type transport system ATP-binding protein